MLPKKHRLTLRKERFFFKQVERCSSTTFLFLFKKNNKKVRFAVVIPKKILSLSTRRNALKRRYRATLVENKEILIKPYDVVIFLRKTPKTDGTDKAELLFNLKKICLPK